MRDLHQDIKRDFFSLDRHFLEEIALLRYWYIYLMFSFKLTYQSHNNGALLSRKCSIKALDKSKISCLYYLDDYLPSMR